HIESLFLFVLTVPLRFAVNALKRAIPLFL
ncbi:unnamed protein product, partial [marine sediment metagenome]